MYVMHQRITHVHLLCYVIETVCEGVTLQLECSDDKTVFIIEVLYGRLNADTCPHKKISDLTCMAENALMIVRNHCIGRSSCAVLASNSVFLRDPCQNTYKYLYVKYACEGLSII